MSGSDKIKCVVVGDGAVGKTCMLISYSTDRFPEEYVPTVFDNYSVDLDIGGKKTSLELWDTAGQEAYDHLRNLSYPDTDMFIIDYSCVDRTTFNNIENWYNELKDNWDSKKGRIPIFIVGTKKDLINDPETLAKIGDNGVITMEEAQAVAQKYNAAGCYQCSAKTQEGLKDIFDAVVNAVLKERFEQEQTSGGCCSVF